MGRPCKHKSMMGPNKPSISRTLDKKKAVSATFMLPNAFKALSADHVDDIVQDVDPPLYNGNEGNVISGKSVIFSGFSEGGRVDLGSDCKQSALGFVAPPSSPADSTDNEMDPIPLPLEGHPNSASSSLVQDQWAGSQIVDVEMITQGLTNLLSSPDQPHKGFSADKLRRILRQLPADCTPTACELQDSQFAEPSSLQTETSDETHLLEALVDMHMPQFASQQIWCGWSEPLPPSQPE